MSRQMPNVYMHDPKMSSPESLLWLLGSSLWSRPSSHKDSLLQTLALCDPLTNTEVRCLQTRHNEIPSNQTNDWFSKTRSY